MEGGEEIAPKRHVWILFLGFCVHFVVSLFIMEWCFVYCLLYYCCFERVIATVIATLAVIIIVIITVMSVFIIFIIVIVMIIIVIVIIITY